VSGSWDSGEKKIACDRKSLRYMSCQAKLFYMAHLFTLRLIIRGICHCGSAFLNELIWNVSDFVHISPICLSS
jgi:hypothetical protein